MLPPHLYLPGFRRRDPAFTLVEILVSISILVLIMLSVTLLFSAAQAAIGINNKRSDADAQARSVFDRMSLDFAQMVRRPDVDYFLKDNRTATGTQPGNDQLAFYSQVPGYYLAGDGTVALGVQSPVSLVSYRINPNISSPAYSKLERMGYGLLWNGAVSSSNNPSTKPLSIIFSPLSDSTISATNTLLRFWPAVKDGTTDSPSHFEIAGSQVFRFEYFYLLRGRVVTDSSNNSTVKPPIPSLTPWYDAITGVSGVTDHTSVNGMADVSAIVVTLALADPRSRAFATDAQWTALAALMPDVANSYDSGTPGNMSPGSLTRQWQTVADSAATTVGRPAAAGIRIYQHYFYLPQNSTP